MEVVSVEYREAEKGERVRNKFTEASARTYKIMKKAWDNPPRDEDHYPGSNTGSGGGVPYEVPKSPSNRPRRDQRTKDDYHAPSQLDRDPIPGDTQPEQGTGGQIHSGEPDDPDNIYPEPSNWLRPLKGLPFTDEHLMHDFNEDFDSEYYIRQRGLNFRKRKKLSLDMKKAQQVPKWTDPEFLGSALYDKIKDALAQYSEQIQENSVFAENVVNETIPAVIAQNQDIFISAGVTLPIMLEAIKETARLLIIQDQIAMNTLPSEQKATELYPEPRQPSSEISQMTADEAKFLNEHTSDQIWDIVRNPETENTPEGQIARSLIQKGIVASKLNMKKQAEEEELNINLGAGGEVIPGYKSFDLPMEYQTQQEVITPDIVGDIGENLQFDNNSVNNFRMKDVLVYLDIAQTNHFFEEIARVLRPGGKFTLIENPGFVYNDDINDIPKSLSLITKTPGELIEYMQEDEPGTRYYEFVFEKNIQKGIASKLNMKKQSNDYTDIINQTVAQWQQTAEVAGVDTVLKIFNDVDRAHNIVMKDLIGKYPEGAAWDIATEVVLAVPQVLQTQSSKLNMKKKAEVNPKYDHGTVQTSDVSETVVDAIKNIQENIDKDKLYDGEDEPGWVENGIQKLFHITVLFGVNDNIEDEVKKVFDKYKPVQIETNGIKYFSSDPNYDVAIVRCKSEELTKIHEELKDTLENKETYPNYKPHITIAYLKKGEKLDEVQISNISWEINSLEISTSSGQLEKVSSLNWDKLHAGPLKKEEIQPDHTFIKDKKWQEFRKSLKGLSNAEKYKQLSKWLRSHNNSHRSKVQVTNYINALKRGGQVSAALAVPIRKSLDYPHSWNKKKDKKKKKDEKIVTEKEKKILQMDSNKLSLKKNAEITDEDFEAQYEGELEESAIEEEKNQYRQNWVAYIEFDTPEEREEQIMIDMAGDIRTSPEALAQLATVENTWIQRSVAFNSSTSPDTLAQLSTVDEANVRCNVASHHKTPSEILEILSKDKNASVRSCAIDNPNTPKSELTAPTKGYDFGGGDTPRSSGLTVVDLDPSVDPDITADIGEPLNLEPVEFINISSMLLYMPSTEALTQAAMNIDNALLPGGRVDIHEPFETVKKMIGFFKDMGYKITHVEDAGDGMSNAIFQKPQVKKASILDEPRSTLDSAIWNIGRDNLPMLKPNVKMHIVENFLSYISKFGGYIKPEQWVKNMFYTGSTATYHYNDMSDIDIHIIVDWIDLAALNPDKARKDPKEMWQELHDIFWWTLNKIKLPGTKHPLTYYVVPLGEEKKLIDQKEEIYDIGHDVWLIPPGKIVGLPQEAMSIAAEDASEIMLRIEEHLANARKSVIDYDMLKILEKLNGDNTPIILQKFNETLKKLDDELVALKDEYALLKQKRQEGFDIGKPIIPTESKNYTLGNIIFKLVERYKLMDVLREIKRITDTKPAEHNQVDDIADALGFDEEETT